jgi:hypothetical protein
MSEAASTETVSYDPSPEADPLEVTDARAEMLARHAVFVQGGFSTPDIERERARKDIAHGLEATVGPPTANADRAALEESWRATWDRMGREVHDAQQHRISALGNDPVDPVEAGGMDLDRVKRYKELRHKQAAAGAEADAIKEEADALERDLIEDFANAGMQSVSVDGKTVYLHRSTFAQRAGGVTTEELKAALRLAGLGDLIGETIPAQTLSAYVREVLDREVEDGEETPQLPEPLRDLLELGERYAVRIRASTSKAKRPTT